MFPVVSIGTMQERCKKIRENIRRGIIIIILLKSRKPGNQAKGHGGGTAVLHLITTKVAQDRKRSQISPNE